MAPNPRTSPPSASALLGYAALHAKFSLPCPVPRVTSRLSGAVQVTTRTQHADGTEEVLYRTSRYAPVAESVARQLEFALKNEPLDLCVLAAFCLGEASRASAREAIGELLAASPKGQYARIAGHLYEWLTAERLDYTLPAGAKRIPVLDPQAYFTGPELRDPRWGVVHNLIGSRRMSPVVRRTAALAGIDAHALRERIAGVISSVDPGILDRALTYLYLAETQSSFAIEQEVPAHAKREAFRRLLEQAGAPGRLTEDALVAWHHAVIPEALRQEHNYRGWQNHMAKRGLRSVADYIPPAPADVHELMEGMADIAEQAATGEVDAVIGAACAAFAFVFVHPFGDGNGRLHRFLLHHVLRQSGVTPHGVVLPLSVALEASLPAYAAALTRYSQPRTRLLDYRLDIDADPPRVDVLSPQPAWLYSCFDATGVCELIAQAIEHALTQDLPAELAWLSAYDAAMQSLNEWLNAPQPELDLLVRVVVQNQGRVSKSKRARFERMTDAQIERAEAEIWEAFSEWQASFGSASPQRI